MATYVDVIVPPDPHGWGRRERLGGRVREYRPDLLNEKVRLRPETLEELSDVHAAVSTFGRNADRRHKGLFATMLKSESISSSNIEGYRAQPRDVLSAEFSPDESGDAAVAILRNIKAMEAMVRAMARADRWTHDHIHATHKTLLPHLYRNDSGTGYRDERVWISSGRRGGLLSAAYVPPHQDLVQGYMDDLLTYLNDSDDNPIAKMCIAHAQFETIHPYVDGNGRVGRSLVHGYMTRSGLVDGTVLPWSSVLKTRSDAYIAALNAFRYESDAPEDKSRAYSDLVDVLSASLMDSVGLAQQMHDELIGMESSWRRTLSAYRSDNSIHRCIDVILESPVITPQILQKELNVSQPTVSNLLRELSRTGILVKSKGKYKRSTLYECPDILNIILTAERRAGSVDFDTLKSGPVIPRPPLPDARAGTRIQCDQTLPRKGVRCTLRMGHPGRCRG